MNCVKIIALFSLFCLLICIPQSFAIDDNNVVNDDLNESEVITPQDYYFDVSTDSDGNGSADNPYKNFTDDRIKDNSTVHLANGEYVFEKSRTFSNISFQGNDARNTILNGNGSSLLLNGTVTFKNITLINFNIRNDAFLNASNVIFKDLIPTAGKQNNIFGGAIYAPLNKCTYLENCSFLDNHAEYGGAIYIKGGDLIILNSLFFNNTAYNYGGAIACESNVRISINNTRFIRDSSLNDAGGALYILSSNFKAFKLTITNCSATFGAAITSLKSNLNLNNLTLTGNAAKYEGGAIYQIYGSILLNASKFINNSARNGGGLFIDDVTVNNITGNEFINNTASNYAGAVYSLLMNSINLTANTFENNHAFLFNDTYSTSSINLTIGNGNYQIIVLNQTLNSTLPSSYDLRDYGYVTPVKDQKDGGNCWAFSSIAALESCILKATGEVLDLSEENMKNLMALYSDYGINYRTPNDGGDNDMPIGYLVSWLGPLSEDDDAYDDNSHLSPVLNSLMHVQNVLFLKRNNFTDNDAIKQAILDYGAVSTTMFYSGKLIWDYARTMVCMRYSNEINSTNHAVAIVGWDDNLRVPNAPGPGAWIVKNSWGSSWPIEGQGGYFCVSYYDANFARPGNYASYTFILNDTQHFDKNYQYDFSGPTDYFWNTFNSVWYENAFVATDNEFIAAVSTYFNKDTHWEFDIYVNSKLQLVQNGFSHPGYYTFNFDYPVPVVKGDIFEVLFKITVDGDVAFPISEAISLTKYTYTPGVSFVSYDNGTSFLDLFDLQWYGYPGHSYVTQVACIKAFTQLITLNSTIEDVNITYDSLDLFNITVRLSDENNNPVGNGIVTFTVNGENHTVNVFRGVAFIQLPFLLGINNISCIFTSPNYYSSNVTVPYEVLPIKIDANIAIIQDLNDVYINLAFSKSISENVTVKINDKIYPIESAEGKAYLNLTDLDYGNYNVTVSVDKDVYDCENSTTFFVKFKRTCLIAANLTTIYNSGVLYSVTLFDDFGDAVVNREVKFVIGDEVYYNFTNENGVASLVINLKDSVYPVLISFEGDDSYLKSQNNSVITVKSSIILPLIKDYASNSNYEVTFIDNDGSYLNNTQVTFTIADRNYQIPTDSNGSAVFSLPVIDGNYLLSVLNPSTGEKLSQNIKIMKRITENKDISVFYGNIVNYKLRVCNDDAKFVNGLQVKVVVNSKVYNLVTDKNGYVSLKINLNAGKYIVTGEYKGFRVSNKITVKPTLITKDIKVKKGKTVKFTAKLLNKNGKVLKAKKIKFKFKGKSYKVKTNKKGISTIKFKNLKLGKYKIISSYGKIKVTNLITVKK